MAVIPYEWKEEHSVLSAQLNGEKLKTDVLKLPRCEVDALGWSCDGERLFSCGRDGTLRIFKADKLSEERAVIGSWTSAAAHPLDSNLLAMTSWEGKLRIMDYRTGTAAVEADLRKQKETIDKILGVTWNVQGTALALHTRGDFLQVVNFIEGGLYLANEGIQYSAEIHGTCWDAAGRVWTGLAGTPGLISVTGVSDVVAHHYSTRSLARSRDGTLIASGGQDSLAIIWDSKEIAAMRSFPGATAPVSCIGISGDSRLLAWGCGGVGKDGDSVLYIGGVRTGAQYMALPTSVPVNHIAWHPQRTTVAYASAGDAGSVQILDL